jgi:phosphoribosylanthranilate isomerase
MIRIKICCISSVSEAQLAVEHGAAALGFVSAMPSGPGPIDEALIARITPSVPPGVATFLLTCEVNAERIAAQQRRCKTNTLQLVDEVSDGAHAELRRLLPGIGIVQVIHVVDESSIDEALAAAGDVRAAIETVEPFGVDVCSGVRTDGKLDQSKVASFVHSVAR